MKKKMSIISLVLVIALVLVSCSTDTSQSNPIGESVALGKTKKVDIASMILLNKDGSNNTIDDLLVKEIESDGTPIFDGNLMGYGFPDEDDFDGISLEEIIENTIAQANRADNYSVHFSTVLDIPRGITEYNYYHDQDDNGRFKTTLVENDFLDKREVDLSVISFDGKTYTGLAPEYFKKDESNLPSGLTSAEAFEVLKQINMSGTNSDSGIIVGNSLDELYNSNSYLNIPDRAIKHSLSWLEVYDEGNIGSFIRFKDGLKMYSLGENENVFHIAYIQLSEYNPENKTIHEFYIDKDSYLILYQDMKGMGGDFNQTTVLESYSTGNVYTDDFYK